MTPQLMHTIDLILGLLVAILVGFTFGRYVFPYRVGRRGHVHAWHLIGCAVAEPVEDSGSLRGPGAILAARMACQGSTSYLFGCNDPTCGELRTEILVGLPPKSKGEFYA